MGTLATKRRIRIDLNAYSRQIRRRAIWCGVVSGLAVLFIVLNVLPPVHIRYVVSTNALIDPVRVDGLVRNLKRATSTTDSTRLLDFKVLDRPIAGANVGAQFESSPLIFLNVQSLWNQRCLPVEVESWIDQVTRQPVSISSEIQLSKSIRMADWELKAARHYRDHHAMTARSPAEEADSSTDQSTAFRLVASENASFAAEEPSNARDASSELENDVQTAATRLSQLRASAVSMVQTRLGKINLVDDCTLTTRPDRIAWWMAVSVIIVGLAAGASAGLVHLRLQSAGVYNPQDVVDLLATAGLDVATKLRLPADQIESTDWVEIAGRQVAGTARRTARHLIALSECVLGLWCLAIAARFALDPLWRSLLFDSPLAAFGRLVSGLP